MTDTNPILCLQEARAIARRAIEKAEDLGKRDAFVVVDDGGIVITASRMDEAGNLSYPVSRAKAYGAAVQREASAAFAERFSHAFVGIFMAFQQIVRDAVFPARARSPSSRRDGSSVQSRRG
jgi:uncharacterized protein GlcG (DUF336 family)